MTDMLTEEEQRLIEADAKAAAKNAFPHIRVTPTEEYGDGLEQCRELLLKFCETTAQVLGGDVKAMREACERARHEGRVEVSLGETVHG
eukprot:1829732-Alexandrium_andersonii.AAC.1